ncbi:uncharacterized protein PHALS_05334 [Plasmopara halstedii]|uniref:Uncharacterized protein n=1 Tax=Plasmopara halstedii TaxID=4781 RepID=A0A0P1AAG2_PLAHL|nr:uncharacterized protein PHALS_05334 [Plasmopara halstedii]CEG37554.1 hypothetical protein PHALS_05334 [Plasmopara halstedii]|eukprot:XP_024573923.1 hypothetical protein PHALS_05334 [Plasmopara halstedii]
MGNASLIGVHTNVTFHRAIYDPEGIALKEHEKDLPFIGRDLIYLTPELLPQTRDRMRMLLHLPYRRALMIARTRERPSPALQDDTEFIKVVRMAMGKGSCALIQKQQDWRDKPVKRTKQLLAALAKRVEVGGGGESEAGSKGQPRRCSRGVAGRLSWAEEAN